MIDIKVKQEHFEFEYWETKADPNFLRFLLKNVSSSLTKI